MVLISSSKPTEHIELFSKRRTRKVLATFLVPKIKSFILLLNMKDMFYLNFPVLFVIVLTKEEGQKAI